MPGDAAEEKPSLLHIRVGLPGGTVHDLELPLDATLEQVVARVVQEEKLDRRTVRVRLISAGKLFSDHSVLVRDVVAEGGFLHCAISEGPGEDDNSDRDPDNNESMVQENALVLEVVDVDGEVRIIFPNLTPSSFGRLSQAGFSEDEIRLIRRHFQRMRREARQRQQVREGEEVQRVEEQNEEEDEGVAGRTTRRGPDPRMVLTSGVEGTNADFLMGCVLGYLLGIIVLVLLLDSNASRRWRVGLIAGVATNFAFGILRSSLSLRTAPGF